ncbi:MAG: hypothetical protein LBI05_04650 [Planctomycetaceae bacterium]|jgi:hypothetical protein|nr:hypothetical protein [Planctomycetaceae bacterium]
MVKYTLHLFVSVFAVAVLCLTVAETVSAQDREKINVFDRKKSNTPSREAPPRRVVLDGQQHPVIVGIQNAADPEKRTAGQNRPLYYVLVFVVVPVLIAGIFYWRLLRQKRIERELNDPMFLFNELIFVHQLSVQEKSLIQKISDRNALTTPLQLFVEPSFLLEAWKDDSFVSSQPLVRRLLSKLFDMNTEGGESSTMSGMGSETKVYLHKESGVRGHGSGVRS